MNKRWWSVPIVGVAAAVAWMSACSGQATPLPADSPQMIERAIGSGSGTYKGVNVEGGTLWVQGSTAWFCPTGGTCGPVTNVPSCQCWRDVCKPMCEKVPQPPGLPPPGLTPCGSGGVKIQ